MGVVQDMNTLARFLGVRDLAALTQREVEGRIGAPRVDVAVLFGGSILAGGDVLAEAMRAGVARAYVIAGGTGHTTEALRQRARRLCSDLRFSPNATEAEIFSSYLAARCDLHVDLLEIRSTNCGNNITCLRDLLAEKNVPCRSLLLMQDATMQRRMAAVAQKEMPGVRLLNYATYAVDVVTRGAEDARAEGVGADGAKAGCAERGGAAAVPSDDALGFDHEPLGMWGMARYRTLLMGEIPRLVDDENGYGPRGKGYLAHVDVPTEVRLAWERLRAAYPDAVRAANPAYAS